MTDTSEGALAGLRVIDCTRVLGGPYCTQMLGDHGAEVIKVEPPQGDETRDYGPPFRNDYSSYFAGLNRNKRSIALDLSRDDGREVLLRLLGDADVLVENFKAGTMEKWGMGYAEVLEARFPRLVHCRITGFGADGPLGALPGYDAVVQAFSGLMSINGTAQSGPLRMGIPVVDLGTGLIAGNAILMALHERHRSGRGQFLDITLYDSGVSLLHPHAANFFMSGETPGLAGDSHPNIAPYEQFPTRTCNMFVACGNDRQFRRLCEALGRPEMADDDRFADNGSRVANRPAMIGVLGPLLAEQDGAELCARLLDLGVPAGPVLDVPAVMDHPHTRHRDMAIEMDGYRGTGVPIKFSRTPGAPRRPPPLYNEHGREVLAEAGYGEAEIEALAESGALVDKRKRMR